MLKKESALFFRAVSKKLAPLRERFGLRELDRRADYLGCSLRLINTTTGIEISYSPKDGGLFIRVSRLSNGSFPQYPTFIDEDTDLQTFDLQDIREVRGEALFSDEGKGLDELVSDAVDAIEQSGPKLLRGDFSEFEGARKIVQARVREFKGM